MYSSQNGIIEIKDLATAIEHKMAKSGNVDSAAARRCAQLVMGHFGYSTRIIDNVLSEDERNVFYMLEEWKLLYTEREETTIKDKKQSKEWRIHYWVLSTDAIRNSVQEPEHVTVPSEPACIYDKPETWEDIDTLRAQTSSMPGLPGSAAEDLAASADI